MLLYLRTSRMINPTRCELVGLATVSATHDSCPPDQYTRLVCAFTRTESQNWDAVEINDSFSWLMTIIHLSSILEIQSAAQKNNTTYISRSRNTNPLPIVEGGVHALRQADRKSSSARGSPRHARSINVAKPTWKSTEVFVPMTLVTIGSDL